MCSKFINIILLWTLLCSADCLKILGLFPHVGKSHHDVFEPLLIELAKRGHQMTIVSHFNPKVEPDNWKFIRIGNFSHLQKSIIDLTEFQESKIGSNRANQLFNALTIFQFGNNMCEFLTQKQEIKDMIKHKERFDLILVEYFNSDCSLGIVYNLNTTFVGLQSHVMMPWTYDRFGQPEFTSYIPQLFSKFPSRMSFMERVENTFFHYLHKMLYKYIALRRDREVVQRNLNISIPPLDEIAKESSLLLSNAHYTLNGVKPNVPAILEVGGIHLKKTLNPLDMEIEKFINESTHGVILFSMGSMIKASSFDPIKLQAFIETFAMLKQRIIWKWEADPPSGLSDNVYIVKWAPQMEILNHANTVAFISHGGLLGTTEAVHAGVPMLFLPVYGDQFVNAAAGQENGLGISVPYTEITKEKIQMALQKIVSPEMKASAKSLSDEWKDRRDPLLVAVEEIERVAKHGGKRRRSPARELLPHQLLLLDVIGFLILVLVIFLYIVYKLISILIRIILYFIKGKKIDKTKKD